MTQLDKRFALIRDGQPWYAAAIIERDSTLATFRISTRGATRDAHGQAEQVTNLEVTVRKVLLEGKRMRCAPEGGRPSSLDLDSRGVTGYSLEPAIASKLGLPAEGSAR